LPLSDRDVAFFYNNILLAVFALEIIDVHGVHAGGAPFVNAYRLLLRR
jgi:hypothetical protein